MLLDIAYEAASLLAVFGFVAGLIVLGACIGGAPL